MTLATKNIVWKIGKDEFQEQELGFLSNIQSSLCLFNPPTQKVFPDYQIHSIKSEGNKVVVLPTTRQSSLRIPEEAVKPMDVYVIPSKRMSAKNASGLRLVFKSPKTGELKGVPFDKGMRALSKQFRDKGEFMPIVLNSELSKSTPKVKLYRIDTKKLDMHTDYDRENLSEALRTKQTWMAASA